MKQMHGEQAQHEQTPRWRDLIALSPSEDAIVQVTREYLASWNPEELSRLPVECRPGRMRDGEDISRWAFELASAHCAERCTPAAEPILARMLGFVTAAGRRLAQLNAAEAERDRSA